MDQDDRLLAVTGSTGFVGSAFVRAAKARGFRIRFLSRSAPQLRNGDEWVAFDLSERSAFDPSLFERCHAIVHLAAHIPDDQSDFSAAYECFQQNALSTLFLCRLATEVGISTFIHTSSANAYLPVSIASEQTAMFPAERATYYLTSKMSQELYAAHWGLTHGLRVICLRLSSVYGPGQVKGALVAMTTALIKGRQIKLANAGLFQADFVFIDDVVNALLASLASGSKGSFNIGSGQRSTMAHVIELIRRFIPAEPSLIAVDSASSILDKGFSALDIRKAADAFAYVPTPLERGLQSFVGWMKVHSADKAL